jgi:hypothetical protein
MGDVDGPGQRLDQLGGLVGQPGRAVEPAGEAAALDKLQGEEGQAVVLANLVDLHDVGVLQAGDRLGLGLEAAQLLAAGVAAAQDHLEGDEALELQVPGLVYDSHAAAAQHPQDLVPGDGRRRGSPGRREHGRLARGRGLPVNPGNLPGRRRRNMEIGPVLGLEGARQTAGSSALIGGVRALLARRGSLRVGHDTPPGVDGAVRPLQMVHYRARIAATNPANQRCPRTGTWKPCSFNRVLSSGRGSRMPGEYLRSTKATYRSASTSWESAPTVSRATASAS